MQLFNSILVFYLIIARYIAIIFQSLFYFAFDIINY